MAPDSLLYDEADILERVDEYTLYCYYLKYTPLIGGKYRSPIRREDLDPSFGIFERRYGYGPHEFMWKDMALGIHGTIFDLVAKSFTPNLTAWQARQQICADFNLGGMQYGTPKLVHYEAQYSTVTNIRIISRPFSVRDLAYWRQFAVSLDILQRYNVTSVKSYWLSDDQLTPSYGTSLSFAYRIWNKYQLYFPMGDKAKKFRNNWTDLCVPGFLQLQYKKPLLIITKAYKDVLCLTGLGYEAIAPRSETTLLPKECIQCVQSRYERVVTLFDNDGKHKADEYPFEALHIPLGSQTKDPSDYCKKYGEEQTKTQINQLLYNDKT